MLYDESARFEIGVSDCPTYEVMSDSVELSTELKNQILQS